MAGSFAPGFSMADQWARYNAEKDAEAQREAKRQGTAAGTATAAQNTVTDAYKRSNPDIYPVAPPPPPPLNNSPMPTYAGQLAGMHGGSTSTSGSDASSGAGPRQGPAPAPVSSPGYTSALDALRALTVAPQGSATMQEIPQSHVAGVAPVDTTEANRGIFARAKDQVGATSSGAIAGLRSVLGSRGMLGSGAESRGAASVANAGLKSLGDVSTSQAVSDVTRKTAEAKANQDAAVAQRGQDLTAIQGRNQLAVEQANQQATIRMNALQSLVQALKLLTWQWQWTLSSL